MKKALLLFLLAVSGLSPGNAQNFIDWKANDIWQTMAKKHKDLSPDTLVISPAGKYLKYVDTEGDETRLYFLDEDEKCIYFSTIYDYDKHREVLDSLNRNYRKSHPAKWEFMENNQAFSIEIQEEEWYFTVVTRKKEVKK